MEYDYKKLRALRLTMDVNQAQMADALGFSRSYYSALELGKRKLTAKIVEKILKKVSVNEVFFEAKSNQIDTLKMRGNHEGGNEVNFEAPKNEKSKQALYYENMQKVNKFIHEKLPESEGFSDDIIDIFSLYQLINEFHETRIGDIIHFGVDNIQKIDDLKAMKEIALKTYTKALPFKQIIGEIAEAARSISSKLESIKDDIELGYDFE